MGGAHGVCANVGVEPGGAGAGQGRPHCANSGVSVCLGPTTRLAPTHYSTHYMWGSLGEPNMWGSLGESYLWGSLGEPYMWGSLGEPNMWGSLGEPYM